MDVNAVESASFPAPVKQAAGLVNGIRTDVSSISFADKIMITISQGGRLSQWIQVPLSTASPTAFDTALPAAGEDHLPVGHLTPKTLLGAGGEEREALGHLFATQTASSISTRDPGENRSILVGLGLLKADMGREAFFDMMDLLHRVI
ncbi:MAG: hypothetical protein M1818_002617 [Claussenomyces sp. TS43310]|nr:MAG: hypothetical protein M1818_002617 [Claussenomyces sp. TS43310]